MNSIELASAVPSVADIELQCSDAIAVVVVTGFLGSGKTSLIREHLRNRQPDDTLVVVNEFGEIGLDHRLLEAGDENVYLLDDGCVCCSINDSLEQTLWALHDKRTTGELPSFNRIIIETSGLTDPIPIIRLFRSANIGVSPFRYQGLLTVVDATLVDQTVTRFASARQQLQMADVLVVTKTDLMSVEAVRGVEHRLAALTPSTIDFRGASSNCLEALVTGELDISREAAAGSLADHSIHSEQFNNVATVAKAVRPLSDYDNFDRKLRRAVRRSATGLYRFKAILPIKNSTVSLVFHGVQGFWAPSTQILSTNASTDKGHIVAIGEPSCIADIESEIANVFG